MNPYLEQDDAWHDFHERFIPLAAAMLESQIGDAYIVKIDEHVYIHELDGSQRRFLGRADVFVAEATESGNTATSLAVSAAPHEVTLPEVDEERLSYLEIRDRDNRELVTVIELLSPSNKIGNNRQQYLAKRAQILGSHTHLVEIDLLRGGRRMPMDDLPDCAYCVLVSQAERRPVAGLWPIQLTEPLPPIPIPLHAPSCVNLDLQQAIHQVYDDAGYHKYIYNNPPNPPLNEADAGWAQSLISKTARK